MCSILFDCLPRDYGKVVFVHQDYLDAINVSVLYVITGSMFVVDSGNKNNLN